MISIFTFNREPNYFFQTYERMVDSEQIHLCADTPFVVGISHQKRNTHQSLVDFLATIDCEELYFDEVQEAICNHGQIYTIFLQNINAMRHFLDSDYEDTLFVLEDDLEFAPNWYTYSKEITRRAIEQYGEKVLISPYSAWISPSREHGVSEQNKNFFGAQFLIYTRRFATDFLEWYEAEYWKNHAHLPVDIALNHFIQHVDPEYKFLTFNYSPVQHVGHQTSGLGGGGFHQSPNYFPEKIKEFFV